MLNCNVSKKILKIGEKLKEIQERIDLRQVIILNKNIESRIKQGIMIE